MMVIQNAQRIPVPVLTASPHPFLLYALEENQVTQFAPAPAMTALQVYFLAKPMYYDATVSP